jgi:hypothetical protein
MNLPFEKEDGGKKWEPRRRIGLDGDLTPVEREILDSIDIIEQKCDHGIKVGARAFNISIIAAAVIATTQGPALLKIVLSLFGA